MEEWILYSSVALCISTLIIFFLRYLGIILDSTEEVNIFVLTAFVIAGFISLIFLLNNKNTSRNFNNIINNKTNNGILLFILLIFSVFLLLNFMSQSLAHNKCKVTGLPQVIINMNLVLVILISVLLFNTELNWKMILGIILSVMGLSLVILNQN